MTFVDQQTTSGTPASRSALPSCSVQQPASTTSFRVGTLRMTATRASIDTASSWPFIWKTGTVRPCSAAPWPQKNQICFPTSCWPSSETLVLSYLTARKCAPNGVCLVLDVWKTVWYRSDQNVVRHARLALGTEKGERRTSVRKLRTRACLRPLQKSESI